MNTCKTPILHNFYNNWDVICMCVVQQDIQMDLQVDAPGLRIKQHLRTTQNLVVTSQDLANMKHSLAVGNEDYIAMLEKVVGTEGDVRAATGK